MKTVKREASGRCVAIASEVRWDTSDDRPRYEALLGSLFGATEQQTTEPGEDKSPGSVSDDIFGVNRSLMRSSTSVP